MTRFVSQSLAVCGGSLLVAVVATFISGDMTRAFIGLFVAIILLLIALLINLLAEDD